MFILAKDKPLTKTNILIPLKEKFALMLNKTKHE